MSKKAHLLMGLTLASLLALPVAAADQQQTTQQSRDRIYGSQLMTAQERAEFREQIRNAGSEEERQRLRAEHHVKMQERAKAQGITLPEEPSPQGGKGQGNSQGSSQWQDNSGKGGGMGKGKN